MLASAHHPVGSAAHRGLGRSPRHSNVAMGSRRNRGATVGFRTRTAILVTHAHSLPSAPTASPSPQAGRATAHGQRSGTPRIAAGYWGGGSRPRTPPENFRPSRRPLPGRPTGVSRGAV